MRILCICGKGNVRSVATKYALNRRGYNDVIAVGSRLVSQLTLDMLCCWADVILLAKHNHGERILDELRCKVNQVFTIGEDTWGNPVNLKLEEIIDKQLDLIKL